MLEVPVTTVEFAGRKFPCGGGGFFRLYPYGLSRWAIRRVNERDRQACVFYFHPWEFHEMPQGDIHFGEGSVRPDPFLVKHCGPYAVEQLDSLIAQLKSRNATFHQAREMGNR